MSNDSMELVPACTGKSVPAPEPDHAAVREERQGQ